MDSGSRPGGILKLRELIEEHPSELAYDFRQRFNLSLFDIGHAVTYIEAIMLISVLSRDPASWLGSARQGWSRPASYEWQVAADNFDLLARVNSKRPPKGYPRPWSDADRIGSKKQDPRTVMERLALMNPEEQPDG